MTTTTSSSIKLLVHLLKGEVGSNLPQEKQPVKQSYIQLAVKDQQQHSQTCSEGGTQQRFGELHEFDVQGWWQYYPFNMSHYEKRKFRKDHLLGGITLTLIELMEATGLSNGSGQQQNGVAKIFWCPIKSNNDQPAGRIAIQIDTIDQEDLPEGWQRMSTDDKFQACADVRRRKLQERNQNNQRYDNARQQQGGWNPSSNGNGSSLVHNLQQYIPSGSNISQLPLAVVGTVIALMEAVKQRVPLINQFTQDKYAVAYSVWWLTLGLLAIAVGLNDRYSPYFALHWIINILSGLVLMYFGIVLGERPSIRRYDLPAALLVGMIISAVFNISMGTLFVRVLSMILLGLSAGWSFWFTLVTSGNQHAIYQLTHSSPNILGVYGNAVKDGVNAGITAVFHTGRITEIDQFAARSTIFACGVIAIQWIIIVLHTAASLLAGDKAVEAGAVAVPLSVYLLLFLIPRNANNQLLWNAVVIFNSLLFVIAAFLFYPYILGTIGSILQQFVFHDLVTLLPIPIERIIGVALERSRQNSNGDGSNNDNQQSQYNNQTPGQYNDDDDSGSEYSQQQGGNNDQSNRGYRLSDGNNGNDRQYGDENSEYGSQHQGQSHDNSSYNDQPGGYSSLQQAPSSYLNQLRSRGSNVAN